jgi:hypothetical protein
LTPFRWLLFNTDGSIAWRRLASIAGAAAAVVTWVTFTAMRGNATDAFDYWVDASAPYSTFNVHHYAYSPVFAQLIAPFHLLGFDAYVATQRAVELVCAFWLAGPVLPIALLLPPVATEINATNINLIVVTAIALGFRWPAAWSIVLLTKPTMGVGLLWFAFRREWRKLAVAIGVTAAIAAVSFALNPQAWLDYIPAVLKNDPTPGWPFPYPIWVRLPISIPLVIWGARTNRPWAAALGAILAAPRLYFLSPVMLLGLLPLLPNAAFARRLRAGWAKEAPPTAGPGEAAPTAPAAGTQASEPA